MATIAVTVAWATPLLQELVAVELPAGAQVGEAIARSGLASTYDLDVDRLCIAIFGRRAALDATLRNGDRVELTRPLAADAKDARRKRALAAPIVRGAPRIKRRSV